MTRRLNRLLRAARDEADIDPAEAPALRRALRKAERGIRELLERV